MSPRRKAAFIIFYIGIVLAMLFMFFYVQDRYGRNPQRSRSESDVRIVPRCAGHRSAPAAPTVGHSLEALSRNTLWEPACST